ncbi:MAG: response regulator [Deltaproteobacteria bacterium]|nr:response regulator [Deltaproteobacteria bacterium]
MEPPKPIDILLVEDDEGHALLVQENLKNHGVINKIYTVTDGEMALNFLYRRREFAAEGKAPRPGLILLDLNLPKVDGFAILSQIKKDEDLKIIPVIILTSTEDPKEIDRSYRLGANNYITKPVEYKQFQERIHGLGLFLEIVSLPLVKP